MPLCNWAILDDHTHEFLSLDVDRQFNSEGVLDGYMSTLFVAARQYTIGPAVGLCSLQRPCTTGLGDADLGYHISSRQSLGEWFLGVICRAPDVPSIEWRGL